MTEHRLMEDYSPIEAISVEAGREKSIPKGHISTLHLWWARRPLAACRAAIIAALLPDPGDEKSRHRRNQKIESIIHWGTENGGNSPGHDLTEAVRQRAGGRVSSPPRERGRPVRRWAGWRAGVRTLC